MKNKLIKLIMVLFFSMALISIFCSEIYASGLSEVISGGDDFLSKAESDTKIDEQLLQQTSRDIYNILLSIAIVIDIVVGISIGIKLMTSEAENKAEAKKSLTVFVVGSVIVFGAFGIWKAMVTFLNTI